MEPVLALAKKMNLEHHELSQVLGYSRAAIAHWIKDDEAPMVASKLAECLLREIGHKSTLFVGLVPADKTEVFSQFAKAIGVELKEVL